MKNKPKILTILPARSGSKRLKNKNILSMNGKPLFEYTLDMVKKSKLIDRIVLATDINKIINKGLEDKDNRVYSYVRSKSSASDTSPLDDVLREVVNFYKKKGEEYDMIIMLHVNIPIRKEGEIDKLIKIALKNPEATAICTGVEAEPPQWMFTKCPDGYYYRGSDSKLFRKQDMPKCWNIDGAIQIHRVDALMKGDGTAFDYFGDKIIVVPHERKYGLEIDTQEDLNYVEYLMHKDIF